MLRKSRKAHKPYRYERSRQKSASKCFSKALTSYKLCPFNLDLSQSFWSPADAHKWLWETNDKCGYPKGRWKCGDKKNDGLMEWEENGKKCFLKFSHPKIIPSILFFFFQQNVSSTFPLTLLQLSWRLKTLTLFFQIWLCWRAQKKHVLKKIAGGHKPKNTDRERRQNKMYLCSRQAIQQFP